MPIYDLNGIWTLDQPGREAREVTVPGVHVPSDQVTTQPVLYRRQVDLPDGDWSHATLILDGARFRPVIMIDDEPVAWSEGGMGRLRLALDHPALVPGRSVSLQLRLAGLAQVPASDASRIPAADHWRSNCAACLWDGVRVHLHGAVAIERLIPWHQTAAAVLEVAVETRRRGDVPDDLRLEGTLMGPNGHALAQAVACHGERLVFDLAQVPWWSPESPACCRLQVRLVGNGQMVDECEQTWGRRDIRIEDRAFVVNHRRRCLRAASVVWHRWIRDAEGQALAWDMDWVERELLGRLKDHGADTIRFHLGMPPRSWLDACDRLGLLVQAEWSFFHGLEAGHDSLVHQWRGWLADCLQHPAVVLHHAWNETDGPVLAKGFAALAEATADLPPQILAHRDVCHVHKYWWSLFENPSCAHDSCQEFPQPIMVDEFGGNYLDGEGRPGDYPTLPDAFSRFLGPDHDAARRLRLQSEATGRVAEYWRRLGAAGLSTFCTLGSQADGNHHFLGDLRAGRPKPVWAACVPAWAPVSLSLDLWDRSFCPGQTTSLRVQPINDSGSAWQGTMALRLRPGWSADGEALEVAPVIEQQYTIEIPVDGGPAVHLPLHLPDDCGLWTVEVELRDPPGCRQRLRSCWRIRSLRPQIPEALRAARLWLPPGDDALRAFIAGQGLTMVDDPAAADLLLCGRGSWPALLAGDTAFHGPVAGALKRGAAIALLDLGPHWLGQGYPERSGELGPLQGSPVLADPRHQDLRLPGGLRLRFRELPEPESCVHLSAQQSFGLDDEAACFWNGLRGGLVAPAADMDISGLSPQALEALWRDRGVDPQLLHAGRCVAYELCGQWEFAAQAEAAVEARLRERVRFLAEDAPALAGSLNPRGSIQVIDVGAQLATADPDGARALTVLACCGRQLRRAPLQRLDFANGARLLLSQLLTDARLSDHPAALARAPRERNPDYTPRCDPAAQQLVLGILGELLT